MGVAGSEEEEEPAGLGPEVFTEEFLLGGGVAALRCDCDEECGIGGNLAADREVEAVDFEVPDAELVARDGEAAVAVGFIGAEFAVAGEEVDFLAGGTGHIEEGGGDGLFAEEGGALLILVAVEFGEGYGAAVFAAEEKHHVRLLEAEGFGLPEEKGPDLYLIPLTEEAVAEAFYLAEALRPRLRAEYALAPRKPAKGLEEALKRGAAFAGFLGEDELRAGEVTLKRLATGEQVRLSREEVPGYLLQALG